MAEIASAYLSIIPSMKGAGAAITKGASGEMGAAGKTLGGVMGKALVAGLAITAAGAAIAGKALYSIGSTFDEVSDTIRVKTGATGDALAGLEASAKRVGKSIPVAFDEIGPTIADLNARMGLTGPVLEKLSKQFLEAGRITGEALDVKTFTGAFNAFDIRGKQTSKVMNDLFRVSQASGVGMNELASAVARNAPNLKQFGFSIGESASLIGTLDKAGLDSNRTLATLSRAMVTFAKDGKDPQKALRGTVDQIEKFTKSGKDAAAINLAGEIFGTRGASQFVAAIKSGKVNLDDLTNLTAKSSDTILNASKDTRDFSEQWQLFKNRAMVTLEPIATRVFAAITNGMASINTTVVPAVKAFINEMRTGEGVGGQVADTFQRIGSVLSVVASVVANNKAAFGTFASGILLVVTVTKAWAIAQAALNVVMSANPIGLVVIAIAALAAGLVYAYKHSEKFRFVVDAAFKQTKKIITAVVGFIVPFVKKHWGLLVAIIGGPLGLIVVQVIKHFGTVKSTAVTAVEFVIKQGKRFVEFTKAVGQHIRDAAKFFHDLPGKIRGFLASLPDKLKTLGGQIVDGLKNGIEGAAHKVFEAVQHIIDQIPKKIRQLMGIASPSKVTTYLGGMIGEGLAKGIDGAGKKVSEATQRMLDKLKSQLDSVKSDFASLKDSVAGAFTGNLFEAETAGDFVANLLGTKGQLTQLKAAFAKLAGWGLKPEFLSQLFQSGNGGLILDLAAGTKAQATQADSLFGQVGMLSSQLGTSVADVKFGDKLDAIRDEIKELRKDQKAHPREMGRALGREINGASRAGYRRGLAVA